MRNRDFYIKIVRKFYDSLLLFWACDGNEKELPIVYVLIIEHPISGKKLRKLGIRIVYRIVGNQAEIAEIIAIGRYGENEVYKDAMQRLKNA